MRGYGDSEKPIGKNFYKMELLADDIRDLIKELGESFQLQLLLIKIFFGVSGDEKKNCHCLYDTFIFSISGYQKCILIAHDWGGVVGHYFIRKYPEMLTKYIFFNTAYIKVLLDTVFVPSQFVKSWLVCYNFFAVHTSFC